MSGAETNTPFLGLIKPPIGADDDVWGNRLNQNSDTLDANASGDDARMAALEARIAALEAKPAPAGEYIGSLKFWPGYIGNLPPGWLNCAGQAVAIADYPLLYSVLGNYWGGAGANFNVPDLRGLVLVGMDQGTGRLGGQYGADAPGRISLAGGPLVTLAVAHMPSHQHGGQTDQQGNHNHATVVFVAYGGGSDNIGGTYVIQGNMMSVGSSEAGVHGHGVVTDFQGGNAAHSNCQPGALGYWIIKALNV